MRVCGPTGAQRAVEAPEVAAQRDAMSASGDALDAYWAAPRRQRPGSAALQENRRPSSAQPKKSTTQADMSLKQLTNQRKLEEAEAYAKTTAQKVRWGREDTRRERGERNWLLGDR